MESLIKLNKKKKIILGILFICIILIVALILFSYHDNESNDEVLFRYSYESRAWDPVDFGFVIYNNGIIEEYDNIKDRELKKGKLTKKELKELQDLSLKVKDECVFDQEYIFFDAGTIDYEIYNNKLSKWILLKRSGSSKCINNSKESQKILELIKELYYKYIDTDDNIFIY